MNVEFITDPEKDTMSFVVDNVAMAEWPLVKSPHWVDEVQGIFAQRSQMAEEAGKWLQDHPLEMA